MIVVGVPLDFRLRYGSFGPKDAPAAVVHVADSPARHRDALPAGGLRVRGPVPVLHGPRRRVRRAPRRRHGVAGPACGARRGPPPPPTPRCWRARPTRSTRCASTASCCASSTTTRSSSATAATSSPSRAASSSRRFPGRWLDPGPYGCLGTGLGYAIAAQARAPGSQVVLMLGDGAAGLSLMDVDTLVRHNLPGRHDRRQQLRLGPGKGPHASGLRLRRGRRPEPGNPLRRGSAAPWAAPASW